MKKLTKVLVSVLLILVLGVTTCLFTGVFSSAQAVATDVSVRFAGVDKTDWLTLSGNTIQDADFKIVVSNMSEKDIIVTDLSHTGHSNITFTTWSEGMTIRAGKEVSFGISGDVDNNAVFTTTITYHVKKNPEETSETATAYIYATSFDYTTGHSEGYMESGFLILGLKTGLDLYPVNDSTYTTSKTKRAQGPVAGQSWVPMRDNSDIYDPTTTTTIYLDGSQYKKWEDFGLTFGFYSMPFDGDTARQIANMVGLEIDLSNSGSSTMTLSLSGFEASALPGGESKVTSNYDGSEGFFLHSENGATTKATFSGAIPTEAQTSIKLKMVGNGVGTMTDNFGGIINATSANFEATWNITVYNNDKTALRSRLEDLALEGLNAGSYRDGWSAYEKALKDAYQTLGTIKVKASDVQSALNKLNTAYDKLVDNNGYTNNYRYAVVITNNYYYKGDDDSNPVAMSSHPAYDMTVENGSTYHPIIIADGGYSQPINRKRVVTEKVINVDASTNYTEVINQYYWYINESRFNALNNEFKKKPTKDSQGNNLYTDESWNAYADAIAKTAEDLKKDNIFQKDIDDDCDAIVEARDNLEREGIDTVWLAEGMAWAEQILFNEYNYEDYEDYYDGEEVNYEWNSDELFQSQYTLDLITDLYDAYNNAAEILDEDYTKDQTDAAAVVLWNAIYNLKVVDEEKGLLYETFYGHADVNHYGYYDDFDPVCEDPGLKPLYDDIMDNTSGTYQLNEDEFTSDSWYALQDALKGDYSEGMFMHARTEEPYEAPNNPMGVLYVPAYSMINNIFYLASQDDLNACRDNLLAKVRGLEYELDFSDLEALKDRLADFELTDYTDSTAAAFDTELQKATAMLTALESAQHYGDEDPITQAEIDAQYAALEAAEAQLILKPYFDVDDETPEAVQINTEKGYVYGETIGKTVNQVLEDLNIVHDSEDVVPRVFKKNGTEVPRNAAIGTGYELRLYVDGDVCQTLKLVVVGDVNGDAKITEADFNSVYACATGTGDDLEGIFKEAADVNGDNVLDLSDAATLLMKIRANS